MWEQQVETEVGTRVHHLIGLAIARDLDCRADPRSLISLCDEVFETWSTSRALRSSLRLRCVTTVATYLSRCRPSGFELMGCEESLEGSSAGSSSGLAVADLVWRHRQSGQVVIDEIKSGWAEPLDPKMADQVERLRQGGRERWLWTFAGVRVVPLATPLRSWFTSAEGIVGWPPHLAALEVTR